jgi:putative ABC transport system substrate-binding protein
MQRRAFLSLFGVAVAYRSLGARAGGKRPTVGFLVPGTQAAYTQWLTGFVQRTRELGWRDGDNVEIIYRAREGVKERYAEIVAEFVKLKVDVIVTSGSEGVVAAKQATSAIPIVFAATSDPVATGLVESLAIQAATSPACRQSRPTLPAKRSNYCVSWSPVFGGWRS